MDKIKLKYTHLYKTGGTSINIALRKLGDEYLQPSHHHQYYKPIEGVTNFTVTRDPLTRFISAYRFATSVDNMYHSKYYKHSDYDIVIGKSAEETMNGLMTNRSAYTHGSWLNQSVLLSDLDKSKIIFLRYENLEEEWKRLLAQHGYDNIPLTRCNTSNDIPSVTASQELKAMVKEFYKEDYEYFDY